MATLQDVTDRLIAEGQLNRNSGTNSIKSMKELLAEQIMLSKDIRLHIEGVGELQKGLAPKDNKDDDTGKGDKEEEKRDEDKKDEGLLAALSKIGADFKQSIKKDKTANTGIVKLLTAGVLASAVLFVTNNWDTIVEGFEAIKEPLMKLGVAVWNIAMDVMPFILDNFETIAYTLGGLFVAMKAYQGIVLMQKAWVAGKLAFTALRVAMIGLNTAVMGYAAALAPMLVAAAPFIAIAAGIALVIYGIVEAFQEAMAIFEQTGSFSLVLTEGLSTFLSTILGFIPDLMLGLLSWIAGALGFEKAADWLSDFSVTDLLRNGISTVFDTMKIFFMKAINGVIGFINGALDWVPGVGPNTIRKLNVRSAERDIATKNAFVQGKRDIAQKEKTAKRTEEREVEAKQTKVEAIEKEERSAVWEARKMSTDGKSPIGAVNTRETTTQKLTSETSEKQLIELQQKAAAGGGGSTVVAAPTSNSNYVTNTSNAIMDNNLSSTDRFSNYSYGA